MAAIDFKKAFKELYQPPNQPVVVTVPKMKFVMVDGEGYPGGNPAYEAAIQILYALSYGIKMMPRQGFQPEGYYDYVVPPLEGLWWIHEGEVFSFEDKDNWLWTMMIRQPDFVDEEIFNRAREEAVRKKKAAGLEKARLESFTEGLCLQVMHIGPYSSEPATLALMEKYMAENGYRDTFYRGGKHHEIYLSDPRKASPDKLKTVLRQPIEKC